VGESAQTVRQMLNTLKTVQSATLSDLRTPVVDANAILTSLGASPPGQDAKQRTPVQASIRHAHQADDGARTPEAAPLLPDAQHQQSPFGPAQQAQLPAIASSSSFNELDVPQHSDVWAVLDGELQLLVELAGVQDCLVRREGMPYGFFMEYPDPSSDKHKAQWLHMNDHEQIERRTATSVVYWSLVKLSGQLSPNCASAIDPSSRFYQAMVNDDYDTSWLGETDIGQAARDDDLLLLAVRPEHPAIAHLLKVVFCMRAVNARIPERQGALNQTQKSFNQS
jgi:hypothetical protein